MVLQGYGAACLMASLHCPSARCKEDVVDRFRHIEWKDATEEQRKNLIWVTHGSGGLKTAHPPLTEQEKEQLKKNQQYHFEKVYEYLMHNYGWEYGERFYQEKNLTCEKIPFANCKIKNTKGQCNLFCPYFKQKCTFKED